MPTEVRKNSKSKQTISCTYSKRFIVISISLAFGVLASLLT